LLEERVLGGALSYSSLRSGKKEGRNRDSRKRERSFLGLKARNTDDVRK